MKWLGVVAVLCAAVVLGSAQERKGSLECSLKKMSRPDVADPGLGPNTARHSFDVLNYALDLDIYNCFISPYARTFAGVEVITFRVDTALSAITLNAVNTSLTIDSVGLAGVSFTHGSNILTVNLNRQYLPGETAQVRIWYRHNNVSDGAWYVSNGMVFTDCEPEGARKWFPCWDRPSDKATIDLRAKVPATVKLGSNGRLADSVRVADTLWYRWISRDPVATYLVVISAKVNYNLDIVYWRLQSNPNDSIPIRFYWNAGENQTNLNNIKTKILPMTTYFSNLFGEHPFEKNGFATLNNQFTWGGMENQTLTSLCPNCWSENLVSHEYAHQWYGDMVTCGTWADIWLNEGFATFSEALWYEYSGGYAAYKSDINSNASYYISQNPHWPIYNPSWAITTPPNSQLFNTAITYYKSACILHLLRYTLGDSLFFRAIKAYAQDTTNFKYQSAVTQDFVAKIGQVAGEDMSWFFTPWLNQADHPVYQNSWNITDLGGGQWMVAFKTRQTQTAGFFPILMELRIAFAAGSDTTVRFRNLAPNEVFTFRFGRQPTNVTFDPSSQIVLKQGSTSSGQTLSAAQLSSPATGSTNISRAAPLRWVSAPSAAWYVVQVATDSLFASLVYTDSTASDTTRTTTSLAASTRHYWRVAGRNGFGVGPWSPVWSFTTSTGVDVRPEETIPTETALLQNYPNPFNPSTIIGFQIATRGRVRVRVVDLLGREVARLADGDLPAGNHTVTWNADEVPGGVYFCRMEAGGQVFVRKMLLVR